MSQFNVALVYFFWLPIPRMYYLYTNLDDKAKISIPIVQLRSQINKNNAR